jgi:hypothetical protein
VIILTWGPIAALLNMGNYDLGYWPFVLAVVASISIKAA